MVAHRNYVRIPLCVVRSDYTIGCDYTEQDVYSWSPAGRVEERHRVSLSINTPSSRARPSYTHIHTDTFVTPKFISHNMYEDTLHNLVPDVNQE